MIRAVKYIYWYIRSLVAYISTRKEMSGKYRWQYYCWTMARNKSQPRPTKKEKEKRNDDR